MNHAFDVTGPHFSAAYLVNNAEGIIRRVRRAGLQGFTITHHGKALVYAQLLPAKPIAQPASAAQLPLPLAPRDDWDGADCPLGTDDAPDEPGEDEVRALIGAAEPS